MGITGWDRMIDNGLMLIAFSNGLNVTNKFIEKKYIKE